MLVQLAIFHTMDVVILQLQLEVYSLKITKDLSNLVLALFQTLVAENEFKETEHKAGAMLQALKEASD